MTAIERLKAEMLSLSSGERAELAYVLLRSLDGVPSAAAEEDWDAELARRAEEILGGRAAGRPAEEVFAALREKYA
jgi:putative addiction module component (TIGR02574 family)